MSCDKGEHVGLGRMVKEIAISDVERVQSIRIDADAPKGSREEVSKALDISLIQIDTYQSDGVRTPILGYKTESGGGGVTDSLVSELKNIGCISFFYCITNCCLHTQSNAL